MVSMSWVKEAHHRVTELLGFLEGKRLLLSSRPDVYRLRPLRDFKEYTLRKLEERQIQLLAANVCRALAAQYAVDDRAALAAVLEAVVGPAKELGGNPLLLSFLCLTSILVQRREREFPTSLVPLIRQCVDALAEWHIHKSGLGWPKDLRGSDVIRILGRLALQSYSKTTGFVSSDEIKKLRDVDQKQFFDYLVPARFIEQQGPDYKFPLETLREFYAAQAAVAGPDPFR
jgi:predicted NACHT family NTPase